MKVKLKKLEISRSNYFVLYPLVFEFCPYHVQKLRLITLHYLFGFFFQERFIQSSKIISKQNVTHVEKKVEKRSHVTKLKGGKKRSVPLNSQPPA